ncbi:MAG: hypothetical protein ACYS29_14155, partial [Planctomycetota bacterium]
MKKAALLSVSLLLIVLAPAKAGTYGGGSGTAEDPYLIYDASQMNAIGANSLDWDKHFKLMADIDLSGYTGMQFNQIGGYSGSPFRGTFDGNNHAILKFTYNSGGSSFVGLFQYVDGATAEIRNLGLIDPNVDAGTGDYVGALVSYFHGGTVRG